GDRGQGEGAVDDRQGDGEVADIPVGRVGDTEVAGERQVRVLVHRLSLRHRVHRGVVDGGDGDGDGGRCTGERRAGAVAGVGDGVGEGDRAVEVRGRGEGDGVVGVDHHTPLSRRRRGGDRHGEGVAGGLHIRVVDPWVEGDGGVLGRRRRVRV